MAKEKTKSGDENEPCDDDVAVTSKKKDSSKRVVLEQEQMSVLAQKIVTKKQYLLTLVDRESSTEYGSKLR